MRCPSPKNVSNFFLFFFLFSTYISSAYITPEMHAETLQGYRSKGVLSSAGIRF